MKRKKLLSILLAFILSISLSMPTFAAEIPDKQEIVGTSESESGHEELDEELPATEEPERGGAESQTEQLDSKEEKVSVPKSVQEAENNEEVEELKDNLEVQGASELQDSSQWTVEDFTYTNISQTLNGCDYTRQFKVSGPAVAGFSESGEEKLKTNKNLVIPSVNAQGEKLVGVAAKAFQEKGLESVQFPEGMMVDYDDTVTNVVTRRGNFIIAEYAFAKNNLTAVTLPRGVIAVMSSAFRYNQLKKVTLPHTIWWIENASFSDNELTTVGFPKTCDFQVQIHAFAFSRNQIKSVRLPNYAEVVEKNAFVLNPGAEECPADAPEKEKSLGGVVHMYTDNADLAKMERIHHIGRSAESQHSWHQKLIVGDKPVEEGEWTVSDFTFDGTTITGLSESGIEKRKANKALVLPDRTTKGEYVTALGDATGTYGLFATKEEKFDSVDLPDRITRIGNRAFVENGLSEVVKFPSGLKEIGVAAFQNNSLERVVLPNSVTTLGGGAFGTNQKLHTIVLSKSLTEIPTGAFGCSDAKNWMENLTEVVIPEGITKIGNNAFAGNNIKNIVVPSTVTEIGEYAFSTKDGLKEECTVVLQEGLKKIGNYAFRNKMIKEIQLPSSVNGLATETFIKGSSDEIQTTIVYITKEQYRNKENFPKSSYHTYKIKQDSNDTEWDEFDFTYGTWEEASPTSTSDITFYPASDESNTIVLNPYVVMGLSESGQAKLEKNKDLVIPETDQDGRKVTGVGPKAFQKMGLESVEFPENVKVKYEGASDIIADGVKERGDFIIGFSAFLGNNLTSLELPEGVIGVGANAFNGNQLTNVSIPETMWRISNAAFGKNQIVSINFPKTCDFKLNVDMMAFAINKVKAVRLPDRIEKLEYNVFMQNTGKEDVAAEAPSTWKKGGVVYMYADAAIASESLVCHNDNGVTGSRRSYAQKLITNEEMPDALTPWGAEDFTYSDSGATVTGLSEKGIAKRAENPNLIIPDKSVDGTVITALADATTGGGSKTKVENYGLFSTAEEKIASVVLPKNLERIGNGVFQNCALTSIHFPSTLKTIGEYAFAQNSLITVNLPNSVTEVGAGAFSSNTTLGKVKFSSGMMTIPTSFAENSETATAFTEIVIPEGITSIGDNAFKGNQFTNVEIPKTVKTIGNYAFAQLQDAPKLEKIVLTEGLESIGGYAFQYATVNELKLPTTVTELDDNAFRDCGGEGKVKLYTTNKEQADKLGASGYHEVIYNHLLDSGWSEKDFVFDGTRIVGWSEMGNQTRLEKKELVIPDTNPETKENITEIADNAFKIPDAEVEQLKDSVDSPNGMTTIVLPETLVKIGEKAFEYNSITTIDFPKTLTVIGTSAFHGNQLRQVVLPDSVTTVSSGAFSQNNITEITFPKNLTKLEAGVFSMNIRLEHVKLPNKLTEIGDSAFAGARFTSLQIPKSVTKIGKKAFHLHHLKELTIPGNVKEIGASAFEGTFKAITLKKLILEEGVETIGERAFKEGYLQSVNLPNSLKSLASNAFENNSGTNNDHIVVCYTKNKEHLKWPEASTYKIVFQEDKVVTPPVVQQKVRVNKIKLTGISKKIAAGKKMTLKATVYPANASNKKVTWKSSNKKVATVNSKGVVTMKKKSGGKKVKITAIAADGSGIKATYTITSMKGVVKKVTISGKKTVKAGKSLKLKAKVTASKKANKKVTWTSSNTKYAKVSASGKVKTYKAGKGKKVKITAKATDGSGKKKTVTIKIK